MPSSVNFQDRFLELLEACLVTAGGAVPAMTTLNWNDRVLELLGDLNTAIAAIGSGGGAYTPIERTREWTNLSVSTSGQNYSLSSIPSSGNCLVHCFVFPGYQSASGSLCHVFARPSAASKPVPGGGEVYQGAAVWDFGSYTNGSTYHYHTGGPAILFAESGQIWARRSGSYAGATNQATLDVLGYWTL